MEFRWTQEALNEYQDAAAYYELRLTGLGKRFIQYVEAAELEAIAAPERPRLIHPKCHRIRLAHFPYNFVCTLKTGQHPGCRS